MQYIKYEWLPFKAFTLSELKQVTDDIVIFTRFYGHTAKRVISNSEVTNENQERRRPI